MSTAITLQAIVTANRFRNAYMQQQVPNAATSDNTASIGVEALAGPRPVVARLVSWDNLLAAHSSEPS